MMLLIIPLKFLRGGAVNFIRFMDFLRLTSCLLPELIKSPNVLKMKSLPCYIADKSNLKNKKYM